MKITRENLKNIVREAMVEENAYQEFFKKALEKTGKSIPQMSDEEKKAFFNKIDASWKGKGEKNERFGRGVEGPTFGSANEEDLDEEAVVVSKRTPEGNIVSKLKEELETVNEGPSFKIKNSISKKEWNKTHKDFKSIIDGVHYVMKLTNQGTALVPVKIEESVNEARTVSKPIKVDDDTMVQIVGDNKGFRELTAALNPKTGKPIQKFGFDRGNETANSKEELIKKLQKKYGNGFKFESVNERMGSDKGAVGNANFNNRLKAMRDAKNSVVAFIDTNKGKKLLKVFKTQQTAQQFTKKNMDKLLNTKGVESVGTMPKKEWDAKEAKYAIEAVNEEFKSKDSTFEKVYGMFDKRDYFNAKGLAKVQIGNFERALQKNDNGAQQILDKFNGDMDKAKEYIIQVITDRKKEEAFNQYKAFKAAVDSIQKGNPIHGAVDLVKSRIHNNSQKYTMALYSAFRNQKFNKWKDIHADIDSLIGESVNEAKTYTPKQVKQALEKMVKQLKAKWKQKGGYENFGQRELDKFKKTFGYSPYGSSDEREISDLIDSFEDWAMDYSG